MPRHMPPPLAPVLAAAAVLLCLVAACRLLLHISWARARRRAAATAAAAAPRAHPAVDAALPPPPPPPPSPPRPYTALVVLGSGGHTAEMLTLVDALLRSRSPPARLVYLATATDTHSLAKARALQVEPRGAAAPAVELAVVPRAREVHQAWGASALASARCAAAAVPAVLRARPDVVLTNGPGSAVVVAAAVLGLRALALARARVVYVESVARTRSLSLSGRILYHVVDRFIVQWPALHAAYPLAEFHGRLT